MTPLDVGYWIGCVVLVVSGVSKLPGAPGLEAALRGLGMPAPVGVGRLVGGAEVVLGAAGLALPPGPAARVTAALVAVTFGAFAVVVELARRRGLRDCGCLGVRPAAPTRSHAVANGVLAVVSVAVAVRGPEGLVDALDGRGWAVGLAVVLGVAAVAGAVVAHQSAG